MLVVQRLAKSRLQLLGHPVVVEDGYRSGILFHDVLFFWCYQSDVVPYLMEDGFVVDVDGIVSRIEQVA